MFKIYLAFGFVCLGFGAQTAGAQEFTFLSSGESPGNPAPLRMPSVVLQVALHSKTNPKGSTPTWDTFQIKEIEWGATVDRRGYTENSIFVGVRLYGVGRQIQIFFPGARESEAQAAANVFAERLMSLKSNAKIVIKTPASGPAQQYISADLEGFSIVRGGSEHLE